MGVCCQLCAVSFNIARCRTKDEPESASWGYRAAGGHIYNSGRIDNSFCFPRESGSGCETIFPSPDDGEGVELHLAGPGCCWDGGYNGHRISVAEMEGMTRTRFVVLKPESADPPDDEKDYERNSGSFITACTTAPPDDGQIGPLSVVRYGVDNIFPQNYHVLAPEDQEMTWGFPLHDSCWQIFQRVCRLRLGVVDLQGLYALWERQACGECGFRLLKHDKVLQRCKRGFWRHIPGTEYLVTNPVEIPGFELAVLAALEIKPDGETARYAKRLRTPPSDDSFGRLPEELRRLIVSYLSSHDIAQLRLASRSFRRITKALLRRLIQEEMPWFWELERIEEMYQERCDGIKYRDSTSICSKHDINWLEVWEHVQGLKKSVKGLRNRARVWGLAEDVVDRIKQMREDLNGAVLNTVPSEVERMRNRKLSIENSSSCPRCMHYGADNGE